MRNSTWQRVIVVACVTAQFGVLFEAMALLLGARPDVTMTVVSIAAIMVFGFLCISQGNALYGRKTYLEQWDTALQFRSDVLDNFDKELRRREWAVIWGEGKPR